MSQDQEMLTVSGALEGELLRETATNEEIMNLLRKYKKHLQFDVCSGEFIFDSRYIASKDLKKLLRHNAEQMLRKDTIVY